jgi:hypothetical protein
MSFWLAKGGVCRSSTLNSVLIRSRACLSTSRAACRGLSCDGSAKEPHLLVLLCKLSLELTGLRELCVDVWVVYWWFRLWVWLGIARRIPVTCSVCTVGVLVVGNNKALTHGVIAPITGVVSVDKLVVRGVKEPLEHDEVRYAEEVPLREPVRGRGRQLAGRAVV